MLQKEKRREKVSDMSSTLNELIYEAYCIAQEKNASSVDKHVFTYDEAKKYDPVISTIYKALLESDRFEAEWSDFMERHKGKSFIFYPTFDPETGKGLEAERHETRNFTPM